MIWSTLVKVIVAHNQSRWNYRQSLFGAKPLPETIMTELIFMLHGKRLLWNQWNEKIRNGRTVAHWLHLTGANYSSDTSYKCSLPETKRNGHALNWFIIIFIHLAIGWDIWQKLKSYYGTHFNLLWGLYWYQGDIIFDAPVERLNLLNIDVIMMCALALQLIGSLLVILTNRRHRGKLHVGKHSTVWYLTSTFESLFGFKFAVD